MSTFGEAPAPTTYRSRRQIELALGLVAAVCLGTSSSSVLACKGSNRDTPPTLEQAGLVTNCSIVEFLGEFIASDAGGRLTYKVIDGLGSQIREGDLLSVGFMTCLRPYGEIGEVVPVVAIYEKDMDAYFALGRRDAEAMLRGARK